MKKYFTVVAALVSLAAPVEAQRDSQLLDQQAQAMTELDFLNGEWVGPAVAHELSGDITMMQTERSGTLLGGTIRLVEGRAFDTSGKTLFNAFAVVSYNPRTSQYVITSHAGGYVTSAELNLIATGFEWEVPAGPRAKMHFTATVKNGMWNETGDYVAEGSDPRRTFEMNVRRLRPSDWPAGKPVKRH